VRRKYGLPPAYLLAFSSPSRHKNIPRLLRAYALLKNRVSLPLVLVGHTPSRGLISKEIRQLGLGEQVICTGYVNESEVMPILSSALLMVFPSLYEGFGLPVLDAQSIGTPVASSTAGSLPEVAGKGAAYFDPLSVEGIAATIAECLEQPGRLAVLRDLGRANLGRFSWNRAAAKTLEVYRDALG
jgi:glycosyltransferase involved in cell wall biosynthesis